MLPLTHLYLLAPNVSLLVNNRELILDLMWPGAVPGETWNWKCMYIATPLKTAKDLEFEVPYPTSPPRYYPFGRDIM